MNKTEKLVIQLRWFLRFVPLNVFAAISAPFISPIAILLIDKKWNPFIWWLDDSRYNEDMSDYAEDYDAWLKDRGYKETFWNLYIWHGFRNTMWNLRLKFYRPGGKEYIFYHEIDELFFRGTHKQIYDDFGYMAHENSAGLKWINKNGDENWWVNSGVKISWLYSIIGTSKLYFRVGTDIFYRYSKCVIIKRKWLDTTLKVLFLIFTFRNLFGKTLWYTYKRGTGRTRDHLSIKIQWEKE